MIGYTVCGCPVSKRYTLCQDSGNGKQPSLLFESTDLDEVGSITALSEIFSLGYSCRLVGVKDPSRWVNGTWTVVDATPGEAKCVLVSPSPIDREPDKATSDSAPTVFYFEGKKHSVQLRQRYNNCLSLFKVVGCGSCPDRGLKCLAQEAGFTVPDRFYNHLEEEVLLDTLEQKYKKLGAFELVSPSATRTKNEFASKYRRYWEHSFEAIEANFDELSRRAERAAESRAFKRDQCSKCVIKNSCSSFRHCRGAYPAFEEIVAQCNEELNGALVKSSWPAWQLWAIARGMGNSAKHSRWNIFLAGLKMQGSDGIVHSIKRAKMDIREYGTFKTYEEIAALFSLPPTEDAEEMKHFLPPTDPALRATLWLALNTPHASQRYGWGFTREVVGLGISNKSVTVRWSNGRYLGSFDDLTSIADIAGRLSYGRLAHMTKIAVRL